MGRRKVILQAIVIARDPDEKDIIGFTLRKIGLSDSSSADLERVLEKWSDHPAELILVVVDPGADALQILKSIREVTQVGCILILEGAHEQMIADLLIEGADLVLSKPVSPKLLAAHALAIARRSTNIPNFLLPNLELKCITLDPSTRTVSTDGSEPKRLTHLEFRLLYVLMTNRGHVVPIDAIVERVWGYDGDGDRELVRGLVSRLRQKIGGEDRFIENIPGVGYRFSSDDM
jgi:DNA-binding response OmpR family regulator